jgi:hypothetical protein
MVSTKVQRSVVISFCTKGLNAKNTHRNVSCLGWEMFVGKFSQKRSKVADDARPGRPAAFATEATGKP